MDAVVRFKETVHQACALGLDFCFDFNMNSPFLERKKEEEIEYRELNIGLIEYRKVKGVVRIFQVNYELWVCLVRGWMHCGKYHVRWFEEMVFESSSR